MEVAGKDGIWDLEVDIFRDILPLLFLLYVLPLLNPLECKIIPVYLAPVNFPDSQLLAAIPNSNFDNGYSLA